MYAYAGSWLMLCDTECVRAFCETASDRRKNATSMYIIASIDPIVNVQLKL